MIKSITSDHPDFKPVHLDPSGFNLIIAERTSKETDKESRNGAGKTSILEIIHFCLGSNIQKDNSIHSKALKNHTFTLEVILNNQPYLVSRSVAKNDEITIEGDLPNLGFETTQAQHSDQINIKVSDWNKHLGYLLFGLPEVNKGEKFLPTFRSLFSYFIRQSRESYISPFEFFAKQQEWSKQVNNAYLLGLSWNFPKKWQELKDDEKTLQNLKKVADSNVISDLIGSLGELEARRVQFEEQVRKGQEQINSFEVHPQYREIEQEANRLGSEILSLSNQNRIDRNMITYYQKSFKEEAPASNNSLKELYEESQVLLPENVIKKIDEIEAFHKQVVSNRKSFLELEIRALNQKIEAREAQIKDLTKKKSESLKILKSHGALDEYSRLQQRLSKQINELEEIKNKIKNLKKFNEGKSALKIEKEELRLKASIDYEEREEIRRKSISLFNSNSEALYQSPGELIINVKSTGYEFDTEIERAGSQGIDLMKIFCYDLMLIQLWSQKENSPKTLMHDSTIFDGVDERQIAHALELVCTKSQEHGFQYLCCLNSDNIPWKDFSSDFDVESYKRLELNDTETGGLFGFRF